MDYTIEKLSLVLVFSEPGKHGISLNKLVDVMGDGSSPYTMWSLDAHSPGLVDFKKAGLVISIMDGRYQIETTVNNNKVPDFYLNVVKKCIKVAEIRDIDAFGFNFMVTIPDFKEVKDHFNITLPDQLSFTYLPKTLIALTFQKNNIEYRIEVSDNNQSAFVQLNAHYPYTKSVSSLGDEVEEYFNVSIKEANILVEELLLNG